MTKKQIIEALEGLAPLPLQDDYDNAGLQAGLTGDDVTGVLVCLDITEEVVDEAMQRGCNLIVSHHPLIFRPLRQVSDITWQQRCVMKSILNGITIYSAHTNLDNAEGGVNYRIASMIGLERLEWLQEKPQTCGRSCGSGVIGTLPEPEDAGNFLRRLKDTFGVACLMHSAVPQGKIRRIAICGGAGSFLMEEAKAKGADCFITGEMSYHHYFDADGMLLVAMGHYQSEQFTKELLRDHLAACFPDLRIEMTLLNTNPVEYL